MLAFQLLFGWPAVSAERRCLPAACWLNSFSLSCAMPGEDECFISYYALRWRASAQMMSAVDSELTAAAIAIAPCPFMPLLPLPPFPAACRCHVAFIAAPEDLPMAARLSAGQAMPPLPPCRRRFTPIATSA